MTQNELKKFMDYLKLHGTFPPMLTSTQEQDALVAALEKNGWKYDDEKDRFTQKSNTVPPVELFKNQYNAALELERQQMDPKPKLSESTESFNTLHIINLALFAPPKPKPEGPSGTSGDPVDPTHPDPSNPLQALMPQPKAFSVLFNNESGSMLTALVDSPNLNSGLGNELAQMMKKLTPDFPLFGNKDEDRKLDNKDKDRLKKMLTGDENELAPNVQNAFTHYFNIDQDWNNTGVQDDTQSKSKHMLGAAAIVEGLGIDNPVQKEAAKIAIGAAIKPDASLEMIAQRNSPDAEEEEPEEGSKLAKQLLSGLKKPPTDNI
jgi:hypothetical protein